MTSSILYDQQMEKLYLHQDKYNCHSYLAITNITILSMFQTVMFRSFWACSSYELAHRILTGNIIELLVLKTIVHIYYLLANQVCEMIIVLQHYLLRIRKLSQRLSQYCLKSTILFVNKIKKIPIFSNINHVDTKTATSATKIKIFILINSSIQHYLKVKNNVVNVVNYSLAVINTAMIAAMRSLKNLNNTINNLTISIRRTSRPIQIMRLKEISPILEFRIFHSSPWI